MKNKEITIRSTEHPNAREALQHLEVSGDDHAVLVGDKCLTLKQDELDRIDAAGIEFAYLVDRNGKIMTIPINEH